MKTALVALAASVVLGGCSLGDGDEGADLPGADSSAENGMPPREGEPGEARAIRGWSAALNDGQFDKAASFFAEDAIVEQTEELRLGDRDAAIAFNRSLPCKADVTGVEDEGDTVLAAFKLRDGPGGPCEGAARVRFRFRDGKFSEWRQLAGPAQPDGPAV